jgi:hypothetical protein
MLDRRFDIVVAAVFAVVGLILIVQATSIPLGVILDPIGPSMAFYICGGVMLGGGLWVIAGHVWRWSRSDSHIVEGEGVADEPEYPASPFRTFAIIAACAAYVFALKPAGFLLATPAFLIVALLVVGKRRPGPMLLIAFIYTGGAYLIFAGALGVRLPVGPFTELFRSLGWIVL